MKRSGRFLMLLAAVVLVAAVAQASRAQPLPQEPEFADQIDALADSAIAHRHQFLSILVFGVLGGATGYCVMRGIKKFVVLF